ncbi:hypothetical protein MCOR02_008509 [Pyricularia oryzae]|nr:hypothetical protein MCOR02_008509 [Pyricularia oryzae]
MMSRWSFPWCVVTPTVFNSDLSLVGKLGADNARCLGVLASCKAFRIRGESRLYDELDYVPNLTLDRSLV